MEEISGRVMDSGQDYVIDLRNILHCASDELRSTLAHGEDKVITRPVLFSTQMAFFLWSTKREPATIGVMDDGGTWRSPGPSFKGLEELD